MPQTAKKKSASSRSGSSNNSRSRSASSSAGRQSGSSRGAGMQQQQGGGGEMLQKFMHDSLKDIYWAEKHLLKALPRLSKAKLTLSWENKVASVPITVK